MRPKPNRQRGTGLLVGDSVFLALASVTDVWWPGVTAPGLVNEVGGARWWRVSKCHGMDTDFELSRAAGIQASSHGSLLSFSVISDRSGCNPEPIVLGGVYSLVCGLEAVAWRCAGAGLMNE
jgi:hypothetical protein